MVTAVNQEVNVCLLKLCLALLHKHCFFGRHIQTELSYPFKKKQKKKKFLYSFLPAFKDVLFIFVYFYFFRLKLCVEICAE